MPRAGCHPTFPWSRARRQRPAHAEPPPAAALLRGQTRGAGDGSACAGRWRRALLHGQGQVAFGAWHVFFKQTHGAARGGLSGRARALSAYAAPTACGSCVASGEEMVWKLRSALP